MYKPIYFANSLNLALCVNLLLFLLICVYCGTEKIFAMESSHSSRRSHSQSKSKSSSSYRTRSFASSSSSYSKKIDLAAEAAALKSKLKFIDVLSQKQIELNQKQSELNRLETIRDIEIAEAKLDAIAKIQHEDDRSSRAIDSALSADKTEYVQDYVNTLHNSEPEPVKLNNSSNLPVTPSATTATNCDNRPTNFASTPVCEAQHDFVRATSSDIELTNRASALDRDTDKNNCSPVTCVEDNNFAFARVYDTGVNNSAFASSCSVELSHSVSQPLYTPSTPQINPYALRSQETCSAVYSSQQPNPVMSTKPAYYIPTRSTNEDDPLVRVAQVFAEHASFSRLPPPEPGTFSGDPLKYPSWKSAFQTLIDQKDIPVSERMYYLKRYLSGSARECVENYFLLSTEDAYDEAKKLLDDRFGNSFVIANAFRDKLDAWPKIHYRDGIGLRKFSDFLRQCEVAMRTTRSLCVLNDDRENKKLLKKLPDYLVSRWARIVHDWRIERMTFPPFVEFAKFIDKESNIACDPVTSLQQPGKELNQPDSLRYNNKSSWSSDKSHFRRPPGNVGSFATNSSENYIPSRSKVYENAPRQPVCFFCKDPHILDRCSVFLKKRIDDRKDFLRNNKLCFSCLNPGHYYKFCRRRKTCDICNMYHPTALHGDVHERTDTSERTATTSHNCKLDISDKSSHCSMILPVWISHMSNPELECLVYALLDTQSDSSFISDTTCDRLGIDGPHIQLSLSTMFAKDMRVDSRKMTGLIIRGHNCDIKIPLSTAYTRNEIPANRSHIPTPEIARRWPHLETIANELMSLNSCEIGLLIGYNCSRALLPREVIPPVLNEPFGQKTDLGWGIIGNVDPDINNELKCDEFMFCSHKTESNVQPLHSIREVSNLNIRTRHAFISFKTQVKEIVSPFNILKILETDFSDLHSCSNQTYSREDKQFLNKMSESIHLTSDNHYEMPLPFRDREPTLPNNRAHALQRLLPLRNKFKKDENYRRDYRQFMSDIISKGYAEKVPADELHQDIGRVWYIPHHAVYHPKKPNKIRVVFDCNARFKEQSINDHLLKGPDLTNTLTGVLCRFRKESIAVICDIEQMFYQFRVNTEHRNYLRFLWWINDEEEPTDFRMTVHLFGAGSSPGCANFGLKQAAIDNEEEFGSEVTDFLKRDFYVDDGLKSLPTEREAMNLIDGSRNLLAKCGLRLHKFVSNSKTVVNSIDPEDRAKEIRDLDLFNDELPMERVLGIQWCIESDCFQFHITLNDKPLTRRGILSTVCSIYDPLGFIAPFYY
ncbi:uncharacterized protein LOC126827753 [Patella vulgata]|uniref:uncharacterized protein LOC126827753 n=1 Tax=Patella vulgata TaxID=6465 RepID=UPI00217F6592|nr:uncharacterized protein LOC126827753 [Patella vulgata]